MLLEVGRITRPHGLRGDVLVVLLSDLTSRLAPGSVLQTQRGPLTVERAAPHQDRWIVSFVEISDRSAAESWRGVLLSAEAPAQADDGEVLWVHRLIGSRVELPDGTGAGTVEAVQANPAADLLVLDGGRLVPVVFVTEHSEGRVVIDPPEGLLDL